MRYDAVIIGGGLAGLTAGITLAEEGLSTVIVASGQSSLHFNGGQLELLGSLDGETVARPLEAVDRLPEGHPYRRLGAEKMKKLAQKARTLLERASLRVVGDETANHWHLTPFGAMRPGWLSMDDYPAFDSPRVSGVKSVRIIGIRGFLDFYPLYLQHALEKWNVAAAVGVMDAKGLEPLRRAATECRATAIARLLDNDPSLLRQMAKAVNDLSAGSDAVIMPDIWGVRDNMCLQGIRSLLNKPLWCVSTMPVSVSGLRSQIMLRRRYEALGGTYLIGDRVTGGRWEDGAGGQRLESVFTANLGRETLEAPWFVIATGSMVSGGIVAGPDRVSEPVFGLDVVHARMMPHSRVKADVFAPQPFMACGLDVDAGFRPRRAGCPAANLLAAGAVLGGLNPICNGTGGGVAMLTALETAQTILDRCRR